MLLEMSAKGYRLNYIRTMLLQAGFTPLLLAAAKGHAEMTVFLIERGGANKFMCNQVTLRLDRQCGRSLLSFHSHLRQIYMTRIILD